MPKPEKQLKLLPHLIPKTLWGKSAANVLDRASWQQIRRDALMAANRVCGVCSASEITLDCHEVWEYDDGRGTATLVAVRILCENCHLAVHSGRAEKHGKLDAAIAQLCKVNGIEPMEAEKIHKRAKAVWAKRSKLKWQVIVAKPLLERYPQLFVLKSATAVA